MAITRTALGTTTDKTGTATTVTITSVALNDGDSLFVGVHHQDSTVRTDSVTWGSTSLVRDKTLTDSPTSQNRTSLFSTHNVAAGTATITVTFSAAVDAAAIWASKANFGAGFIGAVDVSSSAAGSGTSPSDAGVTTNVADEIFFSALGTVGPSGDAAGTWSNSWSAGQRAGTTGNPAGSNSTVQEGFKIVTATESSQAALTGITSRPWIIVHATYKQVAFGLPPGRMLIVAQAVKRASIY